MHCQALGTSTVSQDRYDCQPTGTWEHESKEDRTGSDFQTRYARLEEIRRVVVIFNAMVARVSRPCCPQISARLKQYPGKSTWRGQICGSAALGNSGESSKRRQWQRRGREKGACSEAARTKELTAHDQARSTPHASKRRNSTPRCATQVAEAKLRGPVRFVRSQSWRQTQSRRVILRKRQGNQMASFFPPNSTIQPDPHTVCSLYILSN